MNLKLPKWSKRTLVLPLLIVVGLLAAACGEGSGGPVEVPAKANFVASVNLGEILLRENIEDLQRLLGEDGDGASLQESLAEFEQEIGFDLRQIENLRVFGELLDDDLAAEAPDYFGIIARGNVDQATFDAILGSIEGDTELSTYRGHPVLSATQSDEEFSLTLLGGDTLVAGSVEALRDTVDLYEGDLRLR